MMRPVLCSGRRRKGSVVLPLLVFLLLALPAAPSASESCAMMGGTCRDACGERETAEVGDFEDCGAKQSCCTQRPEPRCCVASFDTRDFGPANCSPPEGGRCPKGSANASDCAKLPMCTPKK